MPGAPRLTHVSEVRGAPDTYLLGGLLFLVFLYFARLTLLCVFHIARLYLLWAIDVLRTMGRFLVCLLVAVLLVHLIAVFHRMNSPFVFWIAFGSSYLDEIKCRWCVPI